MTVVEPVKGGCVDRGGHPGQLGRGSAGNSEVEIRPNKLLPLRTNHPCQLISAEHIIEAVLPTMAPSFAPAPKSVSAPLPRPPPWLGHGLPPSLHSAVLRADAPVSRPDYRCLTCGQSVYHAEKAPGSKVSLTPVARTSLTAGGGGDGLSELDN